MLMEQLLDLRASVMKPDSFAAVSAAISLSLGNVICLNGTTLLIALAITKDELATIHT